MILRSFASFIFIGLILCVGLLVFAQEQGEEDARELFLSSRPIKSNSEASAKADVKPSENSDTRKSRAGGNKNSAAGDQKSKRIGIGYTLYKRGTNGKPISVDPSYKFQNGDAVRATIESNIDGYLYIIYAENDENPTLLFPDHRLKNGNNEVAMHAPYEVPSSKDENPQRRWFFFSGEPSIDKLYIIVSLDPIAGVPIGEELGEYYQKNKARWSPSAELWVKIKEKAKPPALISKTKTFGQTQSKTEEEAIGRSLSLYEDAPQPSVVSIGSAKDVFVSVIELTHK